MQTSNWSEREKLELGLWYDANHDAELRSLREAAAEIVYDFNQTRPSDAAQREKLLQELLGSMGKSVEILSPFQVDYGSNIHIGAYSFINHGAYLMDCAPIHIGAHVFIGPNLGAYTAQHPLLAQERNLGLERALPITIEDNCWIGADVKLMPGVKIGHNAVIGAGSVVTHDIPAGVVAWGTPCVPRRTITSEDSIYKQDHQN